MLQRCVGGYTQNTNESLNNLIWSFAPKTVFSGIQTVQIATFLATGIFNEGYGAVLSILHGMKITIGPAAFALSKELDADRIKTAKKRTLDASKESRIARRSRRSAAEEAAHEAEGPLYEAGMAD